MECHCLPVVELPHTSRLYSDFIQNFQHVAGFYAHSPTFESVKQVAGDLRLDAAMRRQVADILRRQNRDLGTDSSTDQSLDRFASGATAIVTGQQVGLFSGPAYTIYKALTALRLAEDLTAAGTSAVAIFWMATEDHDLAEIDHCYWRGKGATERLELLPDVAAGPSVGKLPLGGSVDSLVERAAGLLEGPGAAAVAEALRQSYRPGETYGSAFGKLMARLFAGKGLILLDPLAPELKRLGAPVYRAALDQHAELGPDLEARNKALDHAKYHAQVKVNDGGTLLFVTVDGQRTPLRAHGEGFVAGTQHFSRQQLAELLDQSPESFSANVLLRPVVQDTLLGTAAYVAGPSEVAYFAQASVNYQRLLGRMPVILPRATFTLVPPQSVRLMGNYELEFSDLLRGRPHLRAKMESKLLPQELTRHFEDGEKSLRELLDGLREPITRVDQTLSGALDTVAEKMLFQYSKLQEKAGRALAFRSGVLDTHEQELTGLLYPDAALQERSLCLLPMLAQQGMGLLDELLRRITPGSTQHQVLYL
jgi:bacillithiol biosynthesis cysteine-adding enzyme BshC